MKRVKYDGALRLRLRSNVRHFDYDDFIREKKARYRALFPQLEKKRAPKRRPRDEKEREILLKMDRARRERWIKEGRLEILGPRRYRFNPDRESNGRIVF